MFGLFLQLDDGEEAFSWRFWYKITYMFKNLINLSVQTVWLLSSYFAISAGLMSEWRVTWPLWHMSFVLSYQSFIN